MLLAAEQHRPLPLNYGQGDAARAAAGSSPGVVRPVQRTPRSGPLPSPVQLQRLLTGRRTVREHPLLRGRRLLFSRSFHDRLGDLSSQILPSRDLSPLPVASPASRPHRQSKQQQIVLPSKPRTECYCAPYVW